MIAMSRKAESDFAEDIYREFDEGGRIIDMMEFWKREEELEELVRIEAYRYDLRPAKEVLAGVAGRIRTVFVRKGLDITPAYVRKLVSEVIKKKARLDPEDFEDMLLMRDAFINVARGTHPEMFKRVYNKMERDLRWRDYEGDIKNLFAAMANNCLFHNISNEKGVILAGPPGSGKTFLARVYLSANPHISSVMINPEDLLDPMDPINGPPEKLAVCYDIAKMVSPTLVYIDEGEKVAKKKMGTVEDNLPSKFQSLLDGPEPLHNVFTAISTNHIDRISEPIIRSKRLSVLEVSGYLKESQIYSLIGRVLAKKRMDPEVTLEKVYTVSKRICHTPADFSSFAEKLGDLQLAEYRTLQQLKRMGQADEAQVKEFMVQNTNTLLDALEVLGLPEETLGRAREDIESLLKEKDQWEGLLQAVTSEETYPLRLAHVQRAYDYLMKNPVKSGVITLHEALEAEIPLEPQVGLVIGAYTAGSYGGVLPISSEFIHEPKSAEKVRVTGAVAISGPYAEMKSYVEMADQSALEAFALVQNYLASLMGEELNVPRLMGEYLRDLVIHHQMLNPSYQGGGPSAGFAFAINTLSLILHLPVRNDFGITGAPWSRGKTTKDVGTAVIIGGTEHKSGGVLTNLPRMYVPEKNLKDIDVAVLRNYWNLGKDIVPVKSFSEHASEFFYLNQGHSDLFEAFARLRIEYKKASVYSEEEAQKYAKDMGTMGRQLRAETEAEVIRRVRCIRDYVETPNKDPYLSEASIFRLTKQ